MRLVARIMDTNVNSDEKVGMKATNWEAETECLFTCERPSRDCFPAFRGISLLAKTLWSVIASGAKQSPPRD